jgi:hypothetical protein
VKVAYNRAAATRQLAVPRHRHRCPAERRDRGGPHHFLIPIIVRITEPYGTKDKTQVECSLAKPAQVYDPGPRLAETIEKDAFTSLLCPKTLARGACGCVFRGEDDINERVIVWRVAWRTSLTLLSFFWGWRFDWFAYTSNRRPMEKSTRATVSHRY